MVTVLENVSLKPFNTFGLDVKARYLAELHTVGDLLEILRDSRWKDMPRLFLGGGSNVLFTQDYDGLVLLNRIRGMELLDETEEEVLLKAMSGEVWHEVVLYSIQLGLGGMENLSLIPGSVGASPIQNIGAYGVELKDVFEQLEAINLETGEVHTFDREACAFGYRDSVFKGKEKGKYFILSVTMRLQKRPKLNTSYGAISQTLEKMGITSPTVQDVSAAVCAIRRSKLPDPAVIGNAGSFFKNPEIPLTQYDTLKVEYPDMPGYPTGPGQIKVPAGWLIEACGWKGKRQGETGSHKDQALVLVNYGHARGEEVWNLAQDIQRSVQDKFGILISPEVNVL